MITSKLTDSQILAILKEYESGQNAKECLENMVSTTKHYTIGKRNLEGSVHEALQNVLSKKWLSLP